MPSIPLPLSGSCRCGRVEMRLTKPPLITSACHCRGCQKMSASAFSLTATVPADAFEVTGETVIGGLHGPDLHHHFCGHCKTWMFSRSTRRHWFVNVRPTLFDDAAWCRPYIECCTTERLPFAETGAVEAFKQFPAAEEYERLMEAYREWVGESGGSARSSPPRHPRA